MTPKYQQQRPASDFQKNAGDAWHDAERGPLAITKHGKPRYIVLTVERYEALKSIADTRTSYTAETMPPDMMDAMITAMNDHAES